MVGACIAPYAQAKKKGVCSSGTHRSTKITKKHALENKILLVNKSPCGLFPVLDPRYIKWMDGTLTKEVSLLARNKNGRTTHVSVDSGRDTRDTRDFRVAGVRRRTN